MCPLFPFHIAILYLCLVLPLLLAVAQGAEEIAPSFLSSNPLKLRFLPNQLTTEESNVSEVQLSCLNCHFNGGRLVLEVEHPDVATIDNDRQYKEIVLDKEKGSDWNVAFNVTGQFLGFTKVRGRVVVGRANRTLVESRLSVAVKRKKTIQSKIFSYSVALLVSLAYINMGCAMDLRVVKETLRKPVGPAIGFTCQYVIMPLIAFGLGFVYYNNVPMRLGLFVTGCSPGGGASNMWTVVFGGNLDLSVTMTAISTFAAFFMLPAWIFSMGQNLVLDDDNVHVVIPYSKICIYAFFLVVPLAIGLLMSRFLPRAAAWMAKVLKPLALFLIIFILVFGVWANLYIFSFMTWQVVLTGMGLPWIGFAFGCTLARALNQPRADIIAIAIETGVQNTGMSIFILWFTLDHPLGDITAVVPVAVATMTPLPLLVALVAKKVMEMRNNKKGACVLNEEPEAGGDLNLGCCNKRNNFWTSVSSNDYNENSFKDGEATCPM